MNVKKVLKQLFSWILISFGWWMLAPYPSFVVIALITCLILESRKEGFGLLHCWISSGDESVA